MVFRLIMKNQILIILLMLCLFIFFSCSEKIDTESYYLRDPFLANEKLRFNSNKENDQIWKVSRSKDGYIITERINSKDEFIDKITEKLTKEGSELVSYEFYEKNLGKSIRIYPKEKDLIKWNLDESSLYSGEYIHDGIIFKFVRRRKFLEKKKSILVFQDSFDFRPISKNRNRFFNVNFLQKTYFEKNKGLVKYERIYSNGEKEVVKKY